ncbi:hypothetical protein [Sphingorhabdus sp. M41]|uniref:hypothetical protein n=1 Tax=Sphingorhabdus sp. M41 TaxID=1806885 RepID=UPI00078D7427|nr:hypothetical protein [Sphingorhabdus sp. M41]AMO70536.1 hypothetical protein AZE99_00525 [Sphingorhabdus sp. M41]
MIEAMLVVLTNAVEGRDADFNDWYSNIHARDTMRMRGALAQQRFRFAEEQVQDFADPFPAQYLALYDVYDAVWLTQEHIDRARTPYMIVEDSLDMSRLDDFFYFPLHFRDKKPRTFSNCGVVLEQMQTKPGQEAAFREWYGDVYMADRFRQDGIVSSAFLGFEDYGQMMPFPPGHDHVAIWRLEDENARDAWRGSSPLADCPFIETDKTAISCWDVASKRIIKDDVTYPDSASLAKEEAARARIKAQNSVLVSAKQRIKD